MLQKDAVRCSGIYLDYLLTHRKEGAGMVRLRVRSIQDNLFEGEMTLTADREVRMVDDIAIRVGDTLFENTPDQECFVIQSHNRKRVTIIPSPELAERLENAVQEKERVFLESDLTFLVERVRNWYERYGKLVEMPRSKPACALDPMNPIMLSDNQYDSACLAMASPLAYIWGAPGTGKTRHVLASCIYSCISAGKKVLLTAPTNNALEQSLGGLLQALSETGIVPGGRILRLGVPSEGFCLSWGDVCEDGAVKWWKTKLTDDVSNLQFQEFLLDSSLNIREGQGNPDLDPFPGKQEPELRAEKKQIRAGISRTKRLYKTLSDSRNIMPVIGKFDVVAATVDTCLYRVLPDGAFQPDQVFLDEAGYCSVIKAMALTGYGKALTMLGDHMQLPPVFENEQEVTRLPEGSITRLWKLSSLYLEDVISSDDRAELCENAPARPRFEETAVAALTETHRFGPQLAEILGKRVYGPRFRSMSGSETRICFIDALKRPEDLEKDEFGRCRRISQSEAYCVEQQIEANLSSGWYSVGIIVPYVNQRNLIMETLRGMFRRHGITEDMDDDIVTVHGSQGREWDIVLFCVTDSFSEAFLTNSHRLESLRLINTAVSRARKKLILIGDSGDWARRPGQLVSELFGIAEKIDAGEEFG